MAQFKEQAREARESDAQAIEETTRWLAEGKGAERDGELVDNLANFQERLPLTEQVLAAAESAGDGDTEVTADRRALARVCEFAIVTVSPEFHDLSEDQPGPEMWAALRRQGTELEFWLTGIENLEQPGDRREAVMV